MTSIGKRIQHSSWHWCNVKETWKGRVRGVIRLLHADSFQHRDSPSVMRPYPTKGSCPLGFFDCVVENTSFVFFPNVVYLSVHEQLCSNSSSIYIPLSCSFSFFFNSMQLLFPFFVTVSLAPSLCKTVCSAQWFPKSLKRTRREILVEDLYKRNSTRLLKS